MEIPLRYQESVAAADLAAQQGDWERVAVLMGAVCAQALQFGELELARSAAISEADAWRRDERPDAAGQAIRRALDLASEPESQMGQEIQLTAVLLDAGRLADAERVGRERLSAGLTGALQVVALDTLCGVLLARGDAAGLAGLVAQLQREIGGPFSVAARFRRAQLDRLGGRLEDAAEGFGSCMFELESKPGALGAWAAACSGLAGVAALKGDAQDALLLYDRAGEAWESVGRRGGFYRVLAGRARTTLQLGASTFLPSLLDEGVDYARDRHLLLLESEMLATRGLCCHAAGLRTRARSDLSTALQLAEAAGAALLAGRCRYQLFQVGGAPEPELRRAILELAPDRPWCARAMSALAAVTDDPYEATQLAGAAVCRFTAMGMDPDAELARVHISGAL